MSYSFRRFRVGRGTFPRRFAAAKGRRSDTIEEEGLGTLRRALLSGSPQRTAVRDSWLVESVMLVFEVYHRILLMTRKKKVSRFKIRE